MQPTKATLASPQSGKQARATRWVYGVLLAYALGFLLQPPRVLLIIDEFNYVVQALAFARGELTLPGADPLFPANPLRVASNYPPGTSLLQAPLVAIGGWRWAAALSVVSLVIATLVTMRWLKDAELNPIFAILVPGFFGALFFARLAMSDVPSAALVALSLWLLWRAEKGWLWSFGAGLAAGASLLLREPNAVLLVPFFVGAIARRKCVAWAVILGAGLGIALRLAISHELFGSALYVRPSGYGFSVQSALTNLPQYAIILLVMFPLGVALPFLYRGARRPEFVAAFALYVATFLFYEYDSTRENGFVKGLILVSRFLVPLLPVLAFMAADVYPRLLARIGAGHHVLRRAFAPAAIALTIVAFAIHPALRRLERDALGIVSAIQQGTEEGRPVLTNHHATLKYLSPVYGARRLILRSYITAPEATAFFKRYGGLDVVFLDRSDSDMFRADAEQNRAFLAELGKYCSLREVYRGEFAAARLAILNITHCD